MSTPASKHARGNFVLFHLASFLFVASILLKLCVGGDAVTEDGQGCPGPGEIVYKARPA